tara:strand:- start:7534 stop:8226 length:693 start_codon:yes stop_codon:yes gene_type:complete
MGLFRQNIAKHEHKLSNPSEYLHTFKPFKFIHIPKTAGTAINQSALIERENTDRRSYGHIRAHEIKNIKNFYTFCLIRNPYDKVYSSWNFYNSGNGKRDSKLAMQRFYPTFEEFVLDYPNSKNIDYWHFQRTQKEYITDNNGKVIIDYVGNYYNIKNEWAIIQDNNPRFNGEHIPLPVKNRTNPEDYHPTANGEFKGTWTKKYTREMAQIIYDSWREDFEFFNINKETYR